MNSPVLVLPALALITAAAVTPAAALHWCEDADSIQVHVAESSLTIDHVGALYNCCPERFDFVVSFSGSLIFVQEIEVPGAPCDCDCCFHLSVEIEDVPPGDHVVAFHWFDYETGQWQMVLLDVTIPDVAQDGECAVAATHDSGCLSADPTSTVPDSEISTWSAIKSLYR